MAGPGAEERPASDNTNAAAVASAKPPTAPPEIGEQQAASPATPAPAPAPAPASTSASASPHDSVTAEAGEHGNDDTDSAVASPSVASTLISVTDSVRQFPVENGRTYHALSAGKYWCPNDEKESDRLEIQHHGHRLTFDGALCCCPKKDGARRVLDLGTGTGIWAIEYADEHPEAVVLGVDLSPIQPQFTPPNCTFEVDDIEEEWLWSGTFDFIWWRALMGCFTDTQAMVQKCFNHLEPGGYLEMHDGTLALECDDGTLPADSALLELTNLATEASVTLGRPINVAPRYREIMERAGFVDIVFEKYTWPINAWPTKSKMKELGQWSYTNFEIGLEGLFMALLTRSKGMSADETMVLCAIARSELRNLDIHACWPAYYCYGRKPE